MTKTILLVSMYGRGGVWQYAARYAASLSKLRTVKLVCPNHAESSVLKDLDLVRVKASHSGKDMIWDLFNLGQLASVLREVGSREVSSVHLLDNHPWSIPILVWARLKRKQAIVTQHDPVQHSGEPRAWAQRMINRMQRSLVHRIIVHGKHLKDLLVKKGVRADRIFVSAHGVFNFGIPKTKREPRSLLFIGRILPYKGLDLLLDALLLVKKPYKLYIVGSGDLEPYKELIRLLGKRVIVRNEFVSEQEIADWVFKSSVVVMPYRDGSQSGVIPIAYEYGRAVIATSVGSIPEVVRDGVTGLLVKPKAEELSIAIEELLSDDARVRHMGVAARAFGKKELAWSGIAKRALAVYV